jgi:hypothetical protein
MGDLPTDSVTGLETLQTTLETALHLTRELTRDQLLARLIAAFHSMPAQDRPVLIDAIEREVKARALSRATDCVTGQSMVPNPHARLYVRTHESVFDRNLLERDEMMIATIRAMRVASLIPAVTDIYASWRDATREAMQHVDEATRAVVERLVLDVLAFLREARAADTAMESPSPAAPGSSERVQGS